MIFKKFLKISWRVIFLSNLIFTKDNLFIDPTLYYYRGCKLEYALMTNLLTVAFSEKLKRKENSLKYKTKIFNNDLFFNTFKLDLGIIEYVYYLFKINQFHKITDFKKIKREVYEIFCYYLYLDSKRKCIKGKHKFQYRKSHSHLLVIQFFSKIKNIIKDKENVTFNGCKDFPNIILSMMRDGNRGMNRNLMLNKKYLKSVSLEAKSFYWEYFKIPSNKNEYKICKKLERNFETSQINEIKTGFRSLNMNDSDFIDRNQLKLEDIRNSLEHIYYNIDTLEAYKPDLKDNSKSVDPIYYNTDTLEPYNSDLKDSKDSSNINTILKDNSKSVDPIYYNTDTLEPYNSGLKDSKDLSNGNTTLKDNNKSVDPIYHNMDNLEPYESNINKNRSNLKGKTDSMSLNCPRIKKHVRFAINPNLPEKNHNIKFDTIYPKSNRRNLIGYNGLKKKELVYEKFKEDNNELLN